VKNNQKLFREAQGGQQTEEKKKRDKKILPQKDSGKVLRGQELRSRGF